MTPRCGVGLLMALMATACVRTTLGGPDGGDGGGAGGGSAGGMATGGSSAGGTTAGPLLEITPATLNLPIGATSSVKVSAIAADGTITDVTPAAELRTEPEGVVTLNQGVVRGIGPGVTSLIAKWNQLEARASVSVPSAQVRSIDLLLESAALLPGFDYAVLKGTLVQATAIATMTDNSKVDVTSVALWTVDNPQGPLQVLQIERAGSVSAKSAGRARLKATVGVVTGQIELEVREAHVTSVMVSAQAASVPVNASVPLTAIARFEGGTTSDVTSSAQWSSSALTFEVLRPGLVVARSSGSAAVSASFGGQTGTAMLTATDAQPTLLSFMPSSLTLGVRTTASLRLMATFSDGSASEVTSQALFTSSQPSVASVTSSGMRGVISGLSAGNAEITGRLGALSATAPIVVTAASLQSLHVTPPNATVTGGSGVVNFRARAIYSDNSQTDVSDQVVWSVEDGTIATVSNALGSRGQARGLNGGRTAVIAQLGAVSARAEMVVVASTLTSVEIAPSAISVEAGRTTQLRAVAQYSDGTARDVTHLGAWTSMTPSVATVSNQPGSKGEVRAVVNGSASIRVSVQGQMATATVTVRSAVVVQVVIAPATVTVPLGLPFGCEATAAYSDGTTRPVSDQVQWTSSNPLVGEMRVEQGYAYFESRQPGTTVITATLTGTSPANATFTVTNATLNRVEINPASPVLPVGAYVELSAAGIYSDLTTQYLRYSASWTSSDPSVAAVGNGFRDKGFVQALRPGSTTITATFLGVSATTVLTVNQATLQQIQVTPFAPRLPVGFDTSVRATGIYSDNTTRDLTYVASWTSSAPSVATVGTYAYVQPLVPGTATITATYTGVQGTTAVTVTGATLMTVAISSPAMSPVAVQETRRLTAQGTFSDGMMMDVTPYVTWLSSAAQVAAVSNAYPTQGEVKGLSVGRASITAVRGSVSSMISLEVQ